MTAVDHSEWARALIAELHSFHQITDHNEVSSVFFGGGTPSLMAPETVQTLVDEIHWLWPVAVDVEVTLEANPTSVEMQRFQDFRDAGINRLSMGIQSFSDEALMRLGRTHSAEEAKAAFEIARQIFDRISFDLIYALPDQTEDAWRDELNAALALAVDHLSLYQLTIEPGTVYHSLEAKGKLTLPEDSLAVDLYSLTQELCAEAGMPSYEISNHARAGAECRHNLLYWRYGSYIGIGPGAHGRISSAAKKYATETVRDPKLWLNQVSEKGHGIKVREPISLHQQAEEMVLMGLRMDEGVSLQRYKTLSGQSFEEDVLSRLQSQDLLEIIGDQMKTRPEGRAVLNYVIGQLLA